MVDQNSPLNSKGCSYIEILEDRTLTVVSYEVLKCHRARVGGYLGKMFKRPLRE